jgi:hypothetical protein
MLRDLMAGRVASTVPPRLSPLSLAGRGQRKAAGSFALGGDSFKAGSEAYYLGLVRRCSRRVAGLPFVYSSIFPKGLARVDVLCYNPS